jgi:hypothetical protein
LTPRPAPLRSADLKRSVLHREVVVGEDHGPEDLSELDRASGGWGSDRGGRGETLPLCLDARITVGTRSPLPGEGRPGFSALPRPPPHQACDLGGAPILMQSTSGATIPTRVNSCGRWYARIGTQAFPRAVRRAVTRALPQAVMTARPMIALICR